MVGKKVKDRDRETERVQNRNLVGRKEKEKNKSIIYKIFTKLYLKERNIHKFVEFYLDSSRTDNFNSYSLAFVFLILNTCLQFIYILLLCGQDDEGEVSEGGPV